MFFVLEESFAATRKQTKGKKGRTSRSSKVSRASTQSNLTFQSDATSLLNANDEEMEDDNTVMTTATVATTTSKATKGRKKAAPAAKSTRGKKKIAVIADEANSSVVPDQSALEVQPVKATRRKASRTVSAQVDNTVIESQPSQPTRTRATRGKGKQRISDDESQLRADLEAAINSTFLSLEASTPEPREPVKRTSNGAVKATKGTKRTSDGLPKAITGISTEPVAKATKGTKRTSNGVPKSRMLDSSVVVLDEAPADLEQSKPKRAKKAGKTAPSVPRSSEVVEVPAPKGKKPAKPVRRPLAEIRVEDMGADMEAQPPVPRSLPEPPQQAKSATPRHNTPEISQDDVSSAPSTPTPARPRLSSGMRSSVRKTMTPSAAAIRKVPSTTGSPQSSDAENRPPSSSRGHMRLFSPLRVALASTPHLSPSKRNIVSRLNTTYPWSPRDIEAIFLDNPTKSGGVDKENVPSVDPNLNMDTLDKKALADVVKSVKASLKPEERKMTVEEWVRWSAKNAEERLRTDCEAMVSKFETEGGRAMRSLEGLQCDE